MLRTMALLLIGGLLTNCSIYMAATAPNPVPLEQLHAGMPRTHVIAVLGTPKTTEVVNEERIEMYEFIDGHPSASKLRIVPYIAADFFTLFLAELVLWPLELAVLQGSEGRAVVTYGQQDQDIAKGIQITKRDGTPWRSN
jgi:hypothetical protein